MKKKDAVKLRDENRDKLIGKSFDGKDTGWDIKDVIVGSRSNVGSVYDNMWKQDISNELALALFDTDDEDYDVFVISHQWPWGSGDLLYERIESYYKANPS